MIRTLTIVAVLALAAGLAMGFFVAEARSKGPEPTPPANPVLENKVDNYRATYDLTPEETHHLRLALLKYDEGLRAFFRRLRDSHAIEFKGMAESANKEIQAVLDSHRSAERSKPR